MVASVATLLSSWCVGTIRRVLMGLNTFKFRNQSLYVLGKSGAPDSGRGVGAGLERLDDVGGDCDAD